MSGKTVGVLGLGRSGQAAVNSLVACGARVFAHDDARPGGAAVPLGEVAGPAGAGAGGAARLGGASFDDWRNWPWGQMHSLVISPGIPHHHPTPHPAAKRANETAVEIISEVELAMRAEPRARIVAVTGTNGKSTTVALIGHCLREAGVNAVVGGNIGDPVCTLEDPGKSGVIVLELSSYQLETTPSLRADIAVILNITPDHLERHGGMDGYISAKARILHALDEHGLGVFGDGDDHVRELARVQEKAGRRVAVAAVREAPRDDAGPEAMRGAHNAENAAAAAACLGELGLDAADIRSATASFAGLAHRMQPVADFEGITFVNDSKATNGAAAARALSSLENIFWLAGGRAKPDGLGEAIAAMGHVLGVYLFGEAARKFRREIARRPGRACRARLCESMDGAMRHAFDDAIAMRAKGTGPCVILLSPAAASFDQFSNFEERGRAFSTGAAKLIEERSLAAVAREGGCHA